MRKRSRSTFRASETTLSKVIAKFGSGERRAAQSTEDNRVRTVSVKLGPLEAVRYTPESILGPPVLLVHGIGLGKWFWARDQALLAEFGLESWAVDLPGHGDGRPVARM